MKLRYRLRNREARKARALERQAARAARTPEQQLAKLNAASWRGLKERAQLEALIHERKKAA